MALGRKCNIRNWLCRWVSESMSKGLKSGKRWIGMYGVVKPFHSGRVGGGGSNWPCSPSHTTRMDSERSELSVMEDLLTLTFNCRHFTRRLIAWRDKFSSSIHHAPPSNTTRVDSERSEQSVMEDLLTLNFNCRHFTRRLHGG